MTKDPRAVSVGCSPETLIESFDGSEGVSRFGLRRGIHSSGKAWCSTPRASVLPSADDEDGVPIPMAKNQHQPVHPWNLSASYHVNMIGSKCDVYGEEESLPA